MQVNFSSFEVIFSVRAGARIMGQKYDNRTEISEEKLAIFESVNGQRLNSLKEKCLFGRPCRSQCIQDGILHNW